MNLLVEKSRKKDVANMIEKGAWKDSVIAWKRCRWAVCRRKTKEMRVNKKSKCYELC